MANAYLFCFFDKKLKKSNPLGWPGPTWQAENQGDPLGFGLGKAQPVTRPATRLGGYGLAAGPDGSSDSIGLVIWPVPSSRFSQNNETNILRK